MDYLVIKNLWFRYEEEWVLKNISFTGRKGELISIVGPSGCGKTTLLRTIVGILKPQKGTIFIDHKNITQLPIEKRLIGYVPQNQALFPHLTVYENIAFGLKARKLKRKQIHTRVMELANLSGITELLHRKPHELSGGQKQRVSLLRALAPNPKLLLLDEPLSNIDAQLREQLALYIKLLQQVSNTTTIFVTHDLNEAKMLADKIIILDQGKILQINKPIELTHPPRSMKVAQILGLKNIFPIKNTHVAPDKDKIIINTPIGNFSIKYLTNKVKEQKEEALSKFSAVYIDPTKIKIFRKKDEPRALIDNENLLQGRILSVIPDPMANIITLSLIHI